jgi:hypothetical protein
MHKVRQALPELEGVLVNPDVEQAVGEFEQNSL